MNHTAASTFKASRWIEEARRPGGLAIASLAGGRLRPGLLQAPPFKALKHPVSATLAVKRPGPALSWIEQAALARTVKGADTPRLAGVLDAIRQARVGGPFWGQALDALAGGPRHDIVLLRPESPVQLREGLDAALGAFEAGDLLVSLPSRSWAASARRGLERRGVAWLVGPLDPWSVLPGCRRLYVGGDDPFALIGLMLETPVHCLAAGDAAGWGLTVDAADIEARGGRSWPTLARAALLTGVLYRDPFGGDLATCEATIDLLADWRRAHARTRGIGVAVGVSLWKRRAIGDLLQSGAERPAFASTAQVLRRPPAGPGDVAAWATCAPADLESRIGARPLWRLEDGFLRSVGLGSQLVAPNSITLDRRGLHYDPARPSDLETLLAETDFPPALLRRADRLIAAVVSRGLSKYNTGVATRLDPPAGRRRILAIGQVGDDDSVRRAGVGVRDMAAFLARVRAAEPDAEILYKPHPDVEAGLRAGAIAAEDALRHADRIIEGAALPPLLGAVDAVHVLSSLAGFEALLHRRPVTVHGQPFYAGWGLTQDLAPIARRQRRLTLTELAAGALILYPLYRDPLTGLPCPPEVLIERLAEAKAKPMRRLPRARRIAQGRLAQWLHKRAAA